jgi:hypothetical protein
MEPNLDRRDGHSQKIGGARRFGRGRLRAPQSQQRLRLHVIT